MDKREAAAVLGVSVRRVEKFDEDGRLGAKDYVRGKTGKQRDFDPEAVERLKAELESVDVALEAPNRRAAGLSVAAPAGALEHFAELVAARLRPADSRPLWLTRAQAVEVSGLPARRISEAVKASKVAHIGRGSGWRVFRDDVLRLAEGLRPNGSEG